jgi:hypothetical protein
MTPLDCDLRGLAFMPLDVVRLVDSDLFAVSTGAEFKAAVALWCKAWLQVPAASLPNDEKVLAHLSGAGPQWRRVRDVALRGWVLCADGRLYHPVIAEKAITAFTSRIKRRVTVSNFHEKRKKLSHTIDLEANAASENGSQPLQGRGRGTEEKEESSLRSDSARPDGRAAVQGALVLPIAGGGGAIPAEEGMGERVRREQGGEARRILLLLAPTLAPERMGELLGTWCKHLAGDRATLLHVLRDAERAAATERIVGDPIRWLWGLVRQRANTPITQGAPHEVPGGQAERRFYGAGGTDEIREAVIAGVPGLARRLEGG